MKLFKMANTHDYKQLQSVIFYWFHIIHKKSIYTYNEPTWLQNCITHHFLLSRTKKRLLKKINLYSVNSLFIKKNTDHYFDLKISGAK